MAVPSIRLIVSSNGSVQGRNIDVVSFVAGAFTRNYDKEQKTIEYINAIANDGDLKAVRYAKSQLSYAQMSLQFNYAVIDIDDCDISSRWAYIKSRCESMDSVVAVAQSASGKG
jgi:hypothetical protein